MQTMRCRHVKNAIYGSVVRLITQYVRFYISLSACVVIDKNAQKSDAEASRKWRGPSAAETKKARRKALPENSITAKAA